MQPVELVVGPCVLSLQKRKDRLQMRQAPLTHNDEGRSENISRAAFEASLTPLERLRQGVKGNLLPFHLGDVSAALTRIEELEYIVKLLAARPGDDFLIEDAKKAMRLTN
jgi:hypothetical protein